MPINLYSLLQRHQRPGLHLVSRPASIGRRQAVSRRPPGCSRCQHRTRPFTILLPEVEEEEGPRRTWRNLRPLLGQEGIRFEWLCQHCGREIAWLVVELSLGNDGRWGWSGELGFVEGDKVVQGEWEIVNPREWD